MTEKTLNGKCKKLEELKDEKKRLEKEIEKIETSIKDYMTAENLTDASTNKFRITWKTELRFNSSAFRKNHNDLYESFKTKETRKFLVKGKTK